jgi:hypothetical protein
MFSRETEPIIVRYLHDEIKEWKKTRDYLILFPKNAKFEKLLVYEEQVDTVLPFSFETKWKWVANIPIKVLPDTDAEAIRSNLKPYEINLVMKGLFNKEPHFVAASNAQECEKIASTIEQDVILNSLLRKVKPDYTSIFLDFDSYESKVSWIVSILKGPIESYMLKESNIRSLYGIVDRISNQLERFSEYSIDKL